MESPNKIISPQEDFSPASLESISLANIRTLKKVLKAIEKDNTVLDKTRRKFDLIREYEQASEAGIVNEFLANLPKRFPEVFGIAENNSANININATPIEDLELLPVFPGETLADGDCFFSSIYRASVEQGILETVSGCFGGLGDVDEQSFIKNVRGVLSKKIKAGELPKDFEGRDAYDGLAIALNSGNWNAILSAYPSWFVKVFREGLSEKQPFLNVIAYWVKQSKSWTSEIEVGLMFHLLRTCGIHVFSSSEDQEAAPRTFEGKPVLNLWNKGESHWEYFSFIENSRRTQKENSNSLEKALQQIALAEQKEGRTTKTVKVVNENENENESEIEESPETRIQELELALAECREEVKRLQEKLKSSKKKKNGTRKVSKAVIVNEN